MNKLRTVAVASGWRHVAPSKLFSPGRASLECRPAVLGFRDIYYHSTIAYTVHRDLTLAKALL